MLMDSQLNQIEGDSTYIHIYIYICISCNMWKQLAMAASVSVLLAAGGHVSDGAA